MVCSTFNYPLFWVQYNPLQLYFNIYFNIASISLQYLLQCHFNIYFNVTSISTSMLLQYHFNVTSISTSMSLQNLTSFWHNRFYSILKILFTILPNRVIKRHLRLVNKNDMDRHLYFKVYFCCFVLVLIYRFYN